MATENQLTKQLLATIKAAIAKFDSAVTVEQKRILADIEKLMAQLETEPNGNIKKSLKNLTIANEMRHDIGEVIKGGGYAQAVKDFNAAYTQVAAIQNQMFATIKAGYKPTKFVAALKDNAQHATVRSLTGAGLKAHVSEHIVKIVNTGLKTGANYGDTLQKVRDFVATPKGGGGVLQRYTKQITTDGINQFSRNYSKSISDGIGHTWFRYVGACVKHTRPWCRAMVAKDWFNTDELPALLVGNFPEFKEFDGTINEATGLPEGMIDGTSVHTIFEYCGGYNCNHQIIPTSAAVVPAYLREKF